MKERARRAAALRKEEEIERKSLQVIFIPTLVFMLGFSSVSVFNFSLLGC